MVAISERQMKLIVFITSATLFLVHPLHLMSSTPTMRLTTQRKAWKDTTMISVNQSLFWFGHVVCQTRERSERSVTVVLSVQNSACFLFFHHFYSTQKDLLQRILHWRTWNQKDSPGWTSGRTIAVMSPFWTTWFALFIDLFLSE